MPASILAIDPVFEDDGFGGYLLADAVLVDHLEALRAAFGLTADEIALVVSDLGFDAKTPLSVENVTAIYRRGWLARCLKISVRELQLFCERTGLDPFAQPDPPKPGQAVARASSPLLELVDLLASLKTTSVKPAEALYVVWNDDLNGASAPTDDAIGGLAARLRTDLTAVNAEFAVDDDPTGEQLRVRVATVYGTEASSVLFGLLDLTLVREVAFQIEGGLPQHIVEAGDGRLAYHPTQGALSFAGEMTTAIRDDLVAAGKKIPDFGAAIDVLKAASDQAISDFFARYPELKDPYTAFVTSKAPISERRAVLQADLLPPLIARRKEQVALAGFAAAAGSDPGFAESLLRDQSVFHASGKPTEAAISDILGTEVGGLSLALWWSDKATGEPDDNREVAEGIDYALADPGGRVDVPQLPKDPAGNSAVTSAVWSGYVLAPESAEYQFWLETDGAAVRLEIDGQDLGPKRDGSIWHSVTGTVLGGGTFHSLDVRVEGATSRAVLRWQSAGQPKTTIPVELLFSRTAFEDLRTTYVRFLKAISLAKSLNVGPDVVSLVVTEPQAATADGTWLDALVAVGSPPDTARDKLLAGLRAFLDYATLRSRVSPGPDLLLGALLEPDAPSGDGLPRLESVTRWQPASLSAVLDKLGIDRTDLATLVSLWRVVAMMSLIDQGSIVATSLTEATNNPTAKDAAALQSAVRARYDTAGWLAVSKPIHDALRSAQREALVAYVLEQIDDPSIDTPDKLYEHILMDVEMDPCMETSRIRNALSSVQLFIERCLMNLEPGVAPGLINGARWSWMKQYRVWEAFRKVFLWPENWLEPELLDIPSPFYKEFLSEVLGSDITDDFQHLRRSSTTYRSSKRSPSSSRAGCSLTSKAKGRATILSTWSVARPVRIGSTSTAGSSLVTGHRGSRSNSTSKTTPSSPSFGMIGSCSSGSGFTRQFRSRSVRCSCPPSTRSPSTPPSWGRAPRPIPGRHLQPRPIGQIRT